MAYERAEIEDAFQHFQDTAARCAKSGDWAEWSECFTEDAEYYEHHYGRMKGRTAILDWINDTMAEPINNEMRAFPIEWYVIDEERGWVICSVSNVMDDPGDGSDHARVELDQAPLRRRREVLLRGGHVQPERVRRDDQGLAAGQEGCAIRASGRNRTCCNSGRRLGSVSGDAERGSTEPMEFGIFNSLYTPAPGAERARRPASVEHERLMNEVSWTVAADKAGFKYTWATEHHFLTQYSHLSANEIFLPVRAPRTTENIHLGTGIFNITPPVNHPARVAERVAMLDHLTRGASSSAWAGARRAPSRGASASTTRSSPRRWSTRPCPQFKHMWREGLYSFDGKFFSMPPRNVLPKPYSDPHPPMWIAAGNPSTFEKAAQMGIGVLCFTMGSPEMLAPLVEIYKKHDRERRAGRRVRQQQRHGDEPDALPRGRPEGARHRLQHDTAATRTAWCSTTSTRSRSRRASPTSPT